MSVEIGPIDVLVAVGKNIGVKSTPEKIRRTKGHLSGDSRINAIATSDIVNGEFRPGYVIFSSGHTAGESTPSEAAAMNAFLNDNTRRFSPIPQEIPIILEEKSRDTASNAAEVAKILAEIEQKTNRNTRVVLVTTRYHLRNAAKIFRDEGVNVWDWDGYASDEVIARRAKNPQKFLENYRKQKRMRAIFPPGEFGREWIRSAVLHSGPLRPLGNLVIRTFTKRTRK